MKEARITRLHPVLNLPKNEEAPYFDPCPKFQTLHHPKNSLDRIISYLFLRQNKIQGKTFSQRRICKLDSTQTFDGPAQCRVLKIHPPEANKINGWQNVGGEISYDYQNGWKTRLSDICTDIKEDIAIMRKVLMEEGEQKHNYKARIEQLRRYIEEINKMFHIVNLKDDVKKLRGIYRKSREETKPYMKFKGTRFFEIVPQLKQSTKDKTILDDFQVFKPLCEEKLIEKQKFLDDLFKHLNKNKKKQYTQQNQEDTKNQLEALDQLEQILIKSDLPQDQEQQEKEEQKESERQKTHFIFEQFIEESKMNDQQGEENIIDNKSKRVQRTFSYMTSNKNKDKQNAAEEFNSQHYLFEVKDVNSFGQQIRLNKLNQIMNDMFKDQHNFSQELTKYSYQHIKPRIISNISCDNLQQIQHTHIQNKNRELRRMSKSNISQSGKRSSVHFSAFYSTATSKQQLKYI